MQELEVGNKYSVPVAAGEKVVSIRHVYHGTAFDTVFVAGIKTNVVLDVKFPEALMVVEGEA